MLYLANPIYDVFFKYLMQDQAAAKCLLSAILDEEIVLLETLPQERVVNSVERPDLAVIRFDYRVTIRKADGTHKKVLVELQKIREILDIGRFRRYLGENYANPNLVNGDSIHLPITTIYLLGFKLDVRSPVIRVGGTYTDAVTKESIEGTDEFIEALTHHAYFIQIPLLPDKQKTRVERVLAVFSQRWVVDQEQRRLLQIPDELKNDDNAPLVNCLSLAVANKEMQEQAIEEESFDKVLTKEFDAKYQQGKAEGALEAKRDTARRLKRLSVPIPHIVEATGLSEVEIAAL